MKSLRLNRRKHNKSRKLRKGGNGPTSSSSSNPKVSFRTVSALLRSISDKEYVIRELEQDDPLNINEINQKKQQQINAKNQVISIFENNNSFLLKLSSREKEILLNDVLNDRGISIAYANAYLNLKDITLIPNEAIAVALAEHKDIDASIQEEINYKAAAAEYPVNIDFYKNYKNLKTIIRIFNIPEDALMVSKIRAVKRGETPGPVSKNSDHIGFPDPAFANIMGYHVGPEYRNISSQPHPHPILGSDWTASSSSSEKGGRRRRSRKLRSRKLRKSNRRK